MNAQHAGVSNEQAAQMIHQQAQQAQLNSLANQLGQKGAEVAHAMGQLTLVQLQLQAVTADRDQLAAELDALRNPPPTEGGEDPAADTSTEEPLPEAAAEEQPAPAAPAEKPAPKQRRTS